MRSGLIALSSLFCLVGAVQAAGFTFEDMARLQRVSEVVLAPGGQTLCLAVQQADMAHNRMGGALYLSPAAPGGAPRQITFPPAKVRDHSPRFSPDGRQLAFVSNRDGSAQLYLMDLAGGEPRRLTSLPGGAADPRWTPDGQALLVASEVYAACPPLPIGAACNRERAKEQEQPLVKARVIERLFYRHWDSWYEGRRSHLLRVPLAPGAPPVDLTPGDSDVPPVARGGEDPYALSPDGKELAFVKNPDRDLALSTNNDVFVLALEGRGARPRDLTADNRATDHSPRYSPDGRFLAYAAQARPGYEADRFVLWLYDRKSGARRPLTPRLDAHAVTPLWAPDSRRLFFTSTLKARGRIFSLPLAADGAPGEPVEIYAGDVNDLQVQRGPGDQAAALIFHGSSLRRASEVLRLPLTADGRAAGPVQVLTDLNGAAYRNLQLGAVEELWTRTAEGQPLHSWLVKPANFDPARRYPAVVLIHGGPQGAWEDAWFYRWNPQIYAGAGYVVLMPNPRGSDGFGQRFVDEVSGAWGDKPYQDVMRAVDALVALPYVDARRVGALGASFGGYMVNWLAGHTDRFAALVSHDGVYDLPSMHGETEELWFTRWEFGGDPWNSDQYLLFSPSRYAARFKTPTLVITNERDYRVPLGQGMQFFTALQLRGVPSKMLIFPDENHWVLKPQNARLWYATVLDWLHRYLGGAPADQKALQSAASYLR